MNGSFEPDPEPWGVDAVVVRVGMAEEDSEVVKVVSDGVEDSLVDGEGDGDGLVEASVC